MNVFLPDHGAGATSLDFDGRDRSKTRRHLLAELEWSTARRIDIIETRWKVMKILSTPS